APVFYALLLLLSSRRLGFFTQLNMQLAQLSVAHFTRRLSHHTCCGLSCREGNHFTDRLSAGHQHNQTIQTESQTTVRRCTELQRVEQEAEFFALFFFRNTQRTEYFLLHILIVNTDRATAQFSTIQNHI